MVSVVFVWVAAPRTKSSLWSKSSRNLGSMAKISLHALSILKKHMTEFLGINFGRFCRYVVNGQLLRAIKSFYCRPEVCVRVNGEQSKPFHVGVGLRQDAFCHLSFSLFTWIGSTNAAKLMSVPRLEIAKLVVCYSLMIWFCFLPQNLASSAH